MTWSLFRWVWQLEGPLHIGMPPAGSLNRTRLYVPARAIWGALTAELARQEAHNGQEPHYQRVGADLQKSYRFTYLYPAAPRNDTWCVWLPTYRSGYGLSWTREGQADTVVGDRQFRRRLLSTRPGTSIDATTDSAEDGSLRETECIEARWRDEDGRDAGPVAMVGYVFIRAPKAHDESSPERRRLDDVDALFVGGDTRYGLGRLRRVAFDVVKQGGLFGAEVNFDAEVPEITHSTVWAHAHSQEPLMSGALELLGGWDRGSILNIHPSSPLWQPGSGSTSCRSPIRWTIGASGLWTQHGTLQIEDYAGGH
jgi:hypothetical protein